MSVSKPNGSAIRRILGSGLFSVALLGAGGSLAQEITVQDAYARASGKMAKAGAAFMEIVNAGSQDDRLISAQSDIARKVELHTHIIGDDGVAKMRRDEDGFEVPAGGMAVLKRGGDHVMFMGLKDTLAQGDMVTVVLEFENAGKMVVQIPVDLIRKPQMGAMKHKTMTQE